MGRPGAANRYSGIHFPKLQGQHWESPDQHHEKDQCDLPSANNVWGAVLRQHGFRRAAIPDEFPDCYTVGDFIREYPEGTYVVALKNHVVTVENGVLYDTWNSMDENPIYFWRRE